MTLGFALYADVRQMFLSRNVAFANRVRRTTIPSAAEELHHAVLILQLSILCNVPINYCQDGTIIADIMSKFIHSSYHPIPVVGLSCFDVLKYF